MSLGLEVTVIQFIAKLTIVLAGAWIAHIALSGKNPRWRVWLWRVAAVASGVLLVGAMLPPAYRVPLLQAVAEHREIKTLAAVEVEQFAIPAARPQASSSPRSPGSKAESAGPEVFAIAPMAEAMQAAPPTTQPSPVARDVSAPHLRIGEQRPKTLVSYALRLDWSSRALLLYGVIVAALFLRLTAGWFLSHRWATSGTPSPAWVETIASQVADDFRCSAIPVRMTVRFQSPVLIGILRPTILLPQTMLESTSVEDDVRGAIAHEMAHASSHDLGWDSLIAVVLAFIWPHPLAWRIRAAHRAACERVSDRVAADFLGDLAAYQSLLARAALRVSGSIASIGLAMARRADVRDRLAALVLCPSVSRLGRRAAGIAAFLTLGALTLAVGSLTTRPNTAQAAADSLTVESAGDVKPDAKPEPADQKVPARMRPEMLRFTVVRSDNSRPIANATVSIHMYGDKPNINQELTADSNGEAKFEYPDGTQPVYLWAMVYKPGLVPYYVNFGRNLVPGALPTTKTIRMDPGKKVGGKVVDPAGNPVSGAQLSITVPATDTPTDIHYHLLYELTDADGAWSLDGAPITFSGLNISVAHPHFTKSWHPVQDRVDGRYVLDPGLTLSGRVADRSGQAVPKAHITVGRDRWGSVDKPVRVADDGTFQVPGLKPHSTWVTAEAVGFAPQVKACTLDKETKPLDFVLLPGQTTRFKAVNEAGEPVAGVRFIADTWNGFRSLWWQDTTDADGVVSWNGAPGEAVTYHVVGTGYAFLRDVVVQPQEQPHVVRLRRPLKIQGVVTDWRNMAVPEFRVQLGRKLSGRKEISWISHEGSSGRNGKFEIEYNENCDEIYVRIEASGLRPWTSEPIRFAKALHRAVVRLEAGSGLAGLVLSPEGQTVAGAQLTLLTESQGMQFTSGYRPLGGKQSVVSDQAGRFEFLALEEASLITAVHDAGYAELTGDEVKQAGGIRLQAWAKVVATVRRGNKPLASAKVAINPQERREQIVRVFSYGISGTTDADGRVIFNRVVPRNATVSKTIEHSIGSGTTVYPERSVSVSLAPGETATVDLGGRGTSIVGRFVVSGKPPAEHKWALNDAVTISTAGETGNSNARKYYRCLIDQDGSFRADDILPGRYTLRVDLTAVPEPNVCGHGTTMGRIVRDVDVNGGTPTLDLGVIEGTWFERLGAGKPAPLFVAEGIGRENVRMVDLRGRLVLVDFWATWCGPCMAEMPKLLALHKELSADARFQILGLSLDNTRDEAAAAVSKNEWPWMFAFAGPGTSATVPARFEVQSIPEKFLVDVDGKILYRGRDLEEVGTLVRKRLAELPAATSNQAAIESGIRPNPLADDFLAGEPISLAIATNNIDYRLGSQPSLSGPGLMLWSSDGKSIRSIDGIGTSGWLTGPERLAIDAERARLYYCDTLRHRLVAIDRFGRQLFASELSDLHAAAVDERTGDIWCLAVGHLHSGELVILDTVGRERARHPLAGFGLAYSPSDDAFWLVGNAITKVSREGKVLSRHSLPEGAYTLTDVAIDRKRGGCWVLETDHPDVPRSKRQLWKVTPDGAATVVHRFPETTLPRTLVSIDGSPWLAVMKNYTRNVAATREWEIQRFTSDGSPSTALQISASDIVVGLRSGAIWARADDSAFQIDKDGNKSTTIALPPELKSVQMAAF